MEEKETNPSKGVEFMNEMHSLIPEDKWNDYVTEWADAEENYRDDGGAFVPETKTVDLRYENDECVVLVFPHRTNWFDYYDVDDMNTRVMMESQAKRISGQQFTNTYPVVLPKGSNNE